MKSLRKFRRAVFLGILLCPAIAQTPRISPEARQYLDRAFQLIEKNNLYRDQIDWKPLLHEAKQYAAGAQSSFETYPAILYACAKPRNKICELITPENTPVAVQQQCQSLAVSFHARPHAIPLIKTHPSPFVNRALLYATIPVNGRKYGYVVIPRCASSYTEYADPHLRHAWAENLYSAITRGGSEHVQGWILDLRGNSGGGYLATMLAGVQSLLGEEQVLITRGRSRTTYYSIHQQQVLMGAGKHPAQTGEHIDEAVDYSAGALPVVLLHDRGTEGAAESLLIAFKGRSNTLFLGRRTAGYTQVGTFWPLADGAVLWVAQEEVFDRNRQPYAEGIEPDIEIDGPSAPTRITFDPAVQKAEEWLLQRTATPIPSHSPEP
ncbi:S41 family peptidase [Occallatibacter riparius]|uniref:S41 family peptidase n=1 Tax=Occallatibacter riparius TaxID=1002689 RepID=A0A9J7BPS4_9BACT|nr:S41 family peptidase [Occallatibacter riparius]UWZ83125.1 S41 family peptidase [Occallatibacter riparius]